MPENRGREHAEKLMSGAGEALHKDRQGTARAFMLRLRFKSRPPAAVAWATFSDADMEILSDAEGERDHLTMTFMNRIVDVEGHQLERLLEAFESERVDEIAEQDRATVEMKLAANEAILRALAQGRAVSAEELKPIITRITIQPNQRETYGPEADNPDGR